MKKTDDTKRVEMGEIIACKQCKMRLMVAGIRDPEAKAIADHLRTQHPWLG